MWSEESRITKQCIMEMYFISFYTIRGCLPKQIHSFSVWRTFQSCLAASFLRPEGTWEYHFLHVVKLGSQLYPYSQQCRPSAQHWPRGYWQQPHLPVGPLQHEVPEGQKNTESQRMTPLWGPSMLLAGDRAVNATCSTLTWLSGRERTSVAGTEEEATVWGKG